ncbi:calcium-binding protein, partial [Ramlibacter sp.]|uniref:calcium-binding protein n=1 Tax=Ramlibacter sp. TaxID=1917967 RepID=UPI003D152FB7
MPDISRIASADAVAVGESLFGPAAGRSSSDTAFTNNSAWSGAVLFSLLGNDQNGRLTGTGNSSTAIDTLNDVRDVLYAAVSYRAGLVAAATAWAVEGPVQRGIDTGILGGTVVAYLTNASAGRLLTVMRQGAQGLIGDAFQLIQEVGAHIFLDMVRGAQQGRSFAGATTAANFASAAKTFFDGFTSAQLGATGATVLSADAGMLAAMAAGSGAEGAKVRAALAGLSRVSVDVDASVAQRFSLYDPATGQGDITSEWISSRSAFASVYFKKLLSLGGIVQGNQNLRYSDASSGVEVLVGAGSSQRKQTQFGGDSVDSLSGQGFDDRLYGGAGDDTVSGLGGADYLEGNVGLDILDGGEGVDTLWGGDGNDTLTGGAGNDFLKGGVGTDTYQFTGTWGADLVRDADGLGLIDVEGFGVLTGAGAAKVAHNVWQLPDQSVNYTLVNVSQNQSDLFITFKTRPDVIRIEGWTPDKSLGITLPGTITAPATNPALTADIVKKLDPTGNSFVFNGVNYVADGEEPGAQDILNGWTDAESIAGLGGNDGISGDDGADYLDGGEGDDLLLGGRGADVIDGGDGRDAIFGSGLGLISTPTRPDFERGDTTGMEVFSQGFSWTTTRPQLQAGQQNNPLLFRYLEVMGADAGPAWEDTPGGTQ